MTVIEHRLCVDEFRRLGFQQKSRLSGPYAGKLQALWLSAYNLGIVRNRDDKALIAFVDRQTGIAHVKWVREAHHASKAIEGLKAWIAREAPIAWPDTTDARTNKLAVIAAQYAILGNPFPADADAIWQGNAILDGIISGLGEEIRKVKAA